MTPAAWRAVAATQLGGRHATAGEPTQDAFMIRKGKSSVTLALADGHGHPDHFRSADGARFAAELAAELLSELSETTPPQDWASSLLGPTPTALVERWRAKIAQHLAENPFDAAEEDRCRTGAEGIWSAYGTTVLAAVADSTTLGVLQIGDGDVVVVHGPGDVVRPLPEDPANLGTLTSSLGQPDPLASVRTAVVDVATTPVALTWLCTDGFGSARVDQHMWWREVSHDLARFLGEFGPAWVEEHLPGWLEEPATVGGDDVTVGLLMPQKYGES